MLRTKRITRTIVAKDTIWFLTGFSALMALIFAIEFVPKPESLRSTFRLTMTIAYFAAWIGLCIHLQNSRSKCFWALFQWRFEDAPPEMEKAWKNMVEEVDFFGRVLSWIVIAFCFSTMLLVLEKWFPVIALAGSASRLLWWASIIGFALFLYWIPDSIGKILKHFRFLHRQTATCDFFEPRPWYHLWKKHPVESDRRFLLLPPKNGFVAGGRRWEYSKLTQNVISFGSIGSGKTLCVMNSLLERLVESARLDHPMGGVILDFKGDFYEKLLRLCQKHNRAQDLIILSPETSQVWNPLDCEEDASEIANRFVASMKALGQKDSNTTFFFHQAESFIENAIVLLRLTNADTTPPSVFDIYRLANDIQFLSQKTDLLVDSDEELRYDDLQQRCKAYFTSEFYSLPNETRQSVVATLNNMLRPLCTDRIGQMTQQASTVRLTEAVEDSKIIYLHIPSARNPKAGKLVGVLLKLAYYAEVKRKQLDSRRYSFLFSDEFQEYFTGEEGASDTEFYSVSRQYRHLNIIATQNINNFLMKGDLAEAVQSFLSNIKTKIFLQNSDAATNEWASKLFGKYIAEFGGDHIGSLAQIVPNVNPEDFLRLRTPEKNVCGFCDSYILNESDHKVDIANRSARWKVQNV